MHSSSPAMVAASLSSAVVNMALRQALMLSTSSSAIRLSATKTFQRSQTAILLSRQLTKSTIFRLPIVNSLAIHSSISSILSELWESILRAVPKKKTSHRKKRQRFLAGKALKDVTNLNTCAACGNVKRAHLLCPYCVAGRHPSPWVLKTSR